MKEASRTRVPAVTALETAPPIQFASELAIREGNSKKPIYQIHKWWARRLGSVFRSILISATHNGQDPVQIASKFYARQDFPGLVVLDPFVGGGTSVVEAAKCGANVIGVDIDPVACFVTRLELMECDLAQLELAFQQVSNSVKSKIQSLYETQGPNGTTAPIVYAFWTEMVSCEKCGRSYEAHPHYQLRRDKRNRRQIVFCRACHEVQNISLRRVRFTCDSCDAETMIGSGTVSNGSALCPHCEHSQSLSTVAAEVPPDHMLFALQIVSTDGSPEFRKATDEDRAIYSKAAAECEQRLRDKPHWIPDECIPTAGRADRRPISFGYKKYRELFNARQLLALSLLAEAIANVSNEQSREFLAAAFSDSLACNNKFCYYAFDYQKLTPLFGLHAYHRVVRPVENNVWGTTFGRGSFERCFDKLVRGKKFGVSPYEFRYGASGKPARVVTGETINLEIQKTVPSTPGNRFGVVVNGSSENLSAIPAKSVDIVLSDPPYYDNLAYSELSDFYHVWLKLLNLPSYAGNDSETTPILSSLYVKPNSGDHADFESGLKRVFAECYRVLKDEGIMVFTFHHRTEAAWNALGNALLSARFHVSTVFPVRSEGNSHFHSSKGNLKWDAVFCCRKRNNQVVPGVERMRRRARSQIAIWRKQLKASKLSFGKADTESLVRALCTMYRCNSGMSSGETIQ